MNDLGCRCGLGLVLAAFVTGVTPSWTRAGTRLPDDPPPDRMCPALESPALVAYDREAGELFWTACSPAVGVRRSLRNVTANRIYVDLDQGQLEVYDAA